MVQSSSLLPVRHPNQDFFIADIFDALPVKNDRHTMEHPFFALSTKKDIRSVEYERDGVQIVLSPSAKYGLPTMMDKDILLYVGSLLMAEINKGHIPPKTVRFSVHDLMVTTNREANGKGYKLIKNAFERITGCLITTDIKTNEIEQTKGFHILESYEVLKSSHDKKRMVRIEVTVSDWFYNALLGKEVLSINREYFRLRKPLERRIYEIARKHCGKQPAWSVMLENLQQKCGSRSTLDKFRYQVSEIIKKDREDNHFPDYLIALDDKDKVTFTNRIAALHGTVALDDLPRISLETLRRGAAIVEDAGTGWDYRAIREQFTQQLMDGFEPDNVNAAFIGFVKKKVVKRP